MVVLTTSPSLPSSHLRCLAVMNLNSELFTLLSHNDGVIVALYFQVLKLKNGEPRRFRNVPGASRNVPNPEDVSLGRVGGPELGKTLKRTPSVSVLTTGRELNTTTNHRRVCRYVCIYRIRS
jgi:hypothetical protein